MSTDRSRPRTVPTALAALAAGVSEATIRKWASRGRLTRHGRPGRAEYDLAELADLAEKAVERAAKKAAKKAVEKAVENS